MWPRLCVCKYSIEKQVAENRKEGSGKLTESVEEDLHRAEILRAGMKQAVDECHSRRLQGNVVNGGS